MNWNKSVTRSELLCGMVVLLGLLFMIGHGMGAASAAELPSSLEGVPGTISYQGTLTTALGEPVNGTVAMTFRLYSVPTGGSALWTETRMGGNAVPVSNGLFHVQLGSLTPISESILRTETLYLGVQIASDSEMTPREVVGAVPMAVTVPDGAVTSSKLERTIHRLQLANNISMPLDRTDYPVFSLPLDLERETLVTISASVAAQNDAADTVFVTTIYVDGNELQKGASYNKMTFGETITMQNAIKLGAGHHQIVMYVFSWGTNGFVIGDSRTQLIVTEG